MKFPFLKKKKSPVKKNFLQMKSKDQKKILMKAVKESNEKQKKLMKKYKYAF